MSGVEGEEGVTKESYFTLVSFSPLSESNQSDFFFCLKYCRN